MNAKMPSQSEQQEAIAYVLERPLTRPNTSYTKAVFCIVGFIVSNVLLTMLLLRLIDWLGIFSVFPPLIQDIYAENYALFALLMLAFCFLISGLLMMKFAVIGAIRLYQRYAPESVRRRCLFKPTCSEYAILAIKKYGLIIGLIKTYDRLVKRCKGRIYRIDYP